MPIKNVGVALYRCLVAHSVARYKDPKDIIFNVWRPARWANWMFHIKDYNATTGNFTFGYGGFQGARGADTGGDWSRTHLERSEGCWSYLILQFGSVCRRSFRVPNTGS